MPHRVLAEAVREKITAWNALSNDAKAKRYMSFIEWSFKYIGWCALTGLVMRVGRLTGSDAALVLSLCMTALLAVFISIQPFKWIVEIIEFGRASNRTVKKWVALVLILAVSGVFALAVQGVMGRIIDLVVTLSR